MLKDLQSTIDDNSIELRQMILTMKGVLDNIDAKIQKTSTPSTEPKK